VWFRRARLLIVSPDSRVNLARRQAETPLIALFRFAGPAQYALRRATCRFDTNLSRSYIFADKPLPTRAESETAAVDNLSGPRPSGMKLHNMR